jgi:hypothetical protein
MVLGKSHFASDMFALSFIVVLTFSRYFVVGTKIATFVVTSSVSR